MDTSSNTSNSKCCTEGGKLWKCQADSLLLFFSTVTLIGAITRHVSNQKIPTNLVMFVIGIFYGIIIHYYSSMRVPEFPPQDWSWRVTQIIYIPTLIFNAAFSMSPRKFVRSLNVFSFVLLLRSGIMIAITGGFVNYFGIEHNRRWQHALMFGVMISVNSSLNVSYHLKRLGVSDNVVTSISGETLMNNIFLFMLFSWLRTSLLVEEITFKEILLLIFGSMTSFLWGYVVGTIVITIMKRLVFDEEKSLLFMLSAVYFSSLLVHFVKGFTASLSVFMMVVVLRINEPCIERNLLKPLHTTLCTITYLMDRVLFITMGKVITWILIIDGSFKTFKLLVPITIIYGSIFFSRLVSTLILNGILKNRYADWRTYSAAVWGQFNGASSLILVLVTFTDNLFSKETSSWDMLVSIGVVLLMQLINVTVIEIIVQRLGLAIIFTSRRASMDYAVERVQTVIKESIEVQKSSSRFSTTYWKWIEKYTQITSPYSSKRKKLVKYESTPVPSITNCPICKAEEEQALIRNKFENKFQHFNIEYAYRTAIAVAKKSYWSQYEERTIGWTPIKKLSSIIQDANSAERRYMSGRAIIRKMPSSGFYDLFKELLNLISDKIVYKKNIVERRRALTAKFRVQTNLDFWHRFAFLMVFHEYFDFGISCIIFASGLSTIISLIASERPRFLMADGRSYHAFSLELFFLLVFCIVTAMKATAYSVRSFWNSPWNRFDLFIMSITSFHIVVETIEIIGVFEQPTTYIYIIASLRLTRLVHCVRILHYFEPMLMKYVTRGINTRLFENYMLGHGFIIGEEDVRRTLGRHENSKLADEKLKKLIENNIREVLRELAEFHRTYPTIITAIKTHLASRKILNDVKPRLDELKYILINDSEYKILLQVFNEMLFHLSKTPKSIPITSNRYNIVHSVVWMDKRIYTVLEQGIRFDTYPAGTVICKHGNNSDGVYIIISGLVKVTGTPDGTQNLILSNADSPYYFVEDEMFQHYLSVRDTLGLLGVLTKSECLTEAKCETDIEVAFIPMKQMLDGIEKLRTPPSLFYKLWRIVSINIATVLLHKLSHYLGYSKQKIRDELANATLPCFIDCDEFWKTDEIHDIILIQGCIRSKRTKEVFYGPTYIPRYVTHLHFTAKERKHGSVIVLFLTDENYELPSDLEWTSQLESKRRRYGRSPTAASIKMMEEIQSEVKDAEEHPDDIQTTTTLSERQSMQSP